MLKANYHTHTSRCGHAGSYADEEYVAAAAQAGYQVLGMSDHSPWPYAGSYTNPTVRMPVSQLDEYLDSMAGLREQYRDRLRLYIGLECEFFPAYLSWMKEVASRIDFIILGNHFRESDELHEPYFGRTTTPERIRQYVDYTLRGMETGLYRCLAHPDFVFSNYAEFDDHCRQASRELCRASKALHIPLEYNLYGVEKAERKLFKGLGYPCPAFWEIAAEEGCQAIIGVDAHRPDHMLVPQREQAAADYLTGLGIELLDFLPGLE